MLFGLAGYRKVQKPGRRRGGRRKAALFHVEQCAGFAAVQKAAARAVAGGGQRLL